LKLRETSGAELHAQNLFQRSD